MRQIYLTALFAFVFIQLFGQVSLQKTYNYSTSVVKLETQGYKYFLMDVPNSQCKIYNMDHSLYRTINCSVPTGYYLSDIKLISEKLFNSDTQIELAFTYYKYVASGNSYYYIYGSKIVSENGSVIQTIDGAQYISVNKTSDTEYKLFAYCFDYSVSPEKVWTNIYSLPGIYVSSTLIAGSQQDVFLNAFPNPVSDILRLDYVLPEKTRLARLNIVDSKGNPVKKFEIDSHSDHLSLNAKDLSSGVYLYYIEYDHVRSESKKIVVN